MELVTIASATATVGCLAASAGGLAVAGWRRAAGIWHEHRFHSQQRDQLRQEANRARMSALAQWQSRPSSDKDSSWRVMEVLEVVDESDDVRSFYLGDPLGQAPLPRFQPGQFLIVRPALGGSDLPARCYSLSDVPDQDWYRISVKRQSVTAKGQASLSNWLHEHIRPGDCLLTAGPHGEFVLGEAAASATPLVFLAAGVGITPVLSMLKQVLLHDRTRPVSAYLQVQDTQHWPFGELIHGWASQCPSLQVTSYFSRLHADDLPMISGGQVQAGKLDVHAIFRDQARSLDSHFYLCGPDAWMAATVDSLQECGVPAAHIHFESFTGGAATLAAPETLTEWQIEFMRSGLTTELSTAATTVLDTASRLGINVPSACRAGACGSCKLKLRSGIVEYARKPACQYQADEVVSCVARPVGKIQIEA